MAALADDSQVTDSNVHIVDKGEGKYKVPKLEDRRLLLLMGGPR